MGTCTRRRRWRPCTEADGKWKSAKQTAPQESACIRQPDRPIVGVAALLELARWGRRRRQQATGQPPCEATPIELSPPARTRPGTPCPPEPAVGGTAGPGPTRRARRAQPVDGPPAAGT